MMPNWSLQERLRGKFALEQYLGPHLGAAVRRGAEAFGFLSPGGDVQDFVDANREIAAGMRERDMERLLAGLPQAGLALAGMALPGRPAQMEAGFKKVYHGTFEQDRFEPVSHGREFGFHVGTRKAASERVMLKQILGLESPAVFPLHARVEKGLVVDDLNEFTPRKLLLNLKSRYPAFFPEGQKVYDFWLERQLKSQPAHGPVEDLMQRLRQIEARELASILDNKGFDHLRYINRSENKGSLSYIVWHPEQITSQFE